MTSAISTSFKALAFSALNSSTTLNAMAHAITGGRVNRQTLGVSLLRSMVDHGEQHIVRKNVLGARTAPLAQAARTALFSPDLPATARAADSLVDQLVEVLVEKIGPRAGDGVASRMLAGALKPLVQQRMDTRFLHKTVAAMVGNHGWAALEGRIRGAVAGMPGGAFVGRQLRGILEVTMVQAYQMDAAEKASYDLLGALLHSALTGQAGPALETIRRIVSGKAMETASSALRQLQQAFQAVTDAGPGEPLPAALALAGQVDALREGDGEAFRPLPVPRALERPVEMVSDGDYAGAVVLHNQLAEATGQEGLSTERLLQGIERSRQEGQLSDERAGQLAALADRLSPEQLAPQGAADATVLAPMSGPQGEVVEVALPPQRVDTGLALDRQGRVAEVVVASQTAHPLAPQGDAAAKATLEALGNGVVVSAERREVGGYYVDAGYADRVGQLDLSMADSAYGVADAAKDGLRSAFSTGWSAVSWLAGQGGSGGLDHHQSTELRQLYNSCAGDPDTLQVVSRFLNPEVVRDTLAAPVLEQVAKSADGLYDNGYLRLKLSAADQPHTSFRVTLEEGDATPDPATGQPRSAARVRIDLDATWNVAGYGPDAGALRAPQGERPSQLHASASVYVPVGGGAVLAEPKGVWTRLVNQMQMAS